LILYLQFHFRVKSYIYTWNNTGNINSNTY